MLPTTASPTSEVVAGLPAGLQIRRHAARVQAPSPPRDSPPPLLPSTRNCIPASRPPIRSRRTDSPCSGPRCPAPSRAPAHTSPTQAPDGFFSPMRSRRQHADGSSQHRSLITQDIAEHVLGDQHVEAPRIQDQLHRAVVHQQMIQRDVRKLRRHFDHHLAPELRVLEHIRLIDAGHLLAPVPRQVKRHARHPLDLRPRVGHAC